MISTKASPYYVSIMANKWNDEEYTRNCLNNYYKQFQKSKSNTSESTDSVNKINMMTDIYMVGTKVNNMQAAYERTKTFISEHLKESLRSDSLIFNKYFEIELNRLSGVQVSQPEKVEAVKSVEYKNQKFYIPQKMSFIHLDDEIYLRSLYNPKNSIEAANMNAARLLSKKYEYVKQDIKFTEFHIKTVDFKTAEVLNYKVDRYIGLYAKMHKDKVKFEISKHKLNMLGSVQNFKKFKNLIVEYKKCISDLTFKIATYDNVNITYNQALILSYKALIIQAEKNLGLAEIEMLQDSKFIKLRDKTEELKSTYKKSLQAVIDYRREFKEFLIYKKIAAYIYINPLNGEKAINGIKWNLKNPSGKLHSKTTLSSLQKAYNVVKFDRVNKKLIMNAGL